MSTTIATRLSEVEVKEIERLAKEEHSDKSTFLKKVIHRGLQDYKIEYAFKLYKAKKISLGKAAEIAGVSLWRMLDLMRQYDVTFNYDKEDLKQDFETIKSLRNH